MSNGDGGMNLINCAVSSHSNPHASYFLDFGLSAPQIDTGV